MDKRLTIWLLAIAGVLMTAACTGAVATGAHQNVLGESPASDDELADSTAGAESDPDAAWDTDGDQLPDGDEEAGVDHETTSAPNPDNDGQESPETADAADGDGEETAEGDAVDSDRETPPTRIYAAIVTHNEEQPHAVCTPVMTDQATYLANRAATLAFAQMIVDENAAWDFQSDWEYLTVVRNWDTADVMLSTGGKNIVRYLAELAPDCIVVDPHAHETQYNYADVAYLLDGLGAPVSPVVGGFLYLPVEAEAWTRFQPLTPLSGVIFPEHSWTGRILWGAGTFQHQGNDSKASGIWRPRDAAHFHEDDPSQGLVNVGGGFGGFAGLTTLLGRLERGELEAGRMYTLTIFTNQCAVDDGVVESYRQSIRAVAAQVAEGRLVWTPLSQMVEIWRSEYGEQPVIYQGLADQTGDCTPACPDGQVCFPLRSGCVPDCRIAGNACPPQHPACNTTSGLCE